MYIYDLAEDMTLFTKLLNKAPELLLITLLRRFVIVRGKQGCNN